MRRYLIGTSVISRLSLQPPNYHRFGQPLDKGSAISYEYFGLRRANRVPQRSTRRDRPDFAVHRDQLRELLREISPYFLSYAIQERYADIRRILRPQGQLIGDIDTLIAATA